MSFDIENKVALVTGANRGIGKAIVESLIEGGASKVYAAVRNVASAQPLIDSYGDKVVAIEVDLSKPETITNAAGQASDVELLVNNAGILHNASPLAADAISLMADEINVNVYGLINMAQAFAPILKANGGGAFVQLNSVASMKNFSDFATYSASKAAAYSITQGLREKLEEQGVSVYASIPLSEKQVKTNRVTDLKQRRSRRLKESATPIPLLAQDDPTDLAIEALRSLRTSLHFAMMDAAMAATSGLRTSQELPSNLRQLRSRFVWSTHPDNIFERTGPPAEPIRSAASVG